MAADRKYFGVAPDVYLMSEHAMHAQIPQLLKDFGFRGAIMRTHYMMYGYNPVFDVPIGWWVGLDGSRVATIPTYKGEGAQFGRTTVDNWILTRYPAKDAPRSPADFRREFRRIQPLLASRADDAGLRKEDLVKECEGKPGFKWILLEELLSLSDRIYVIYEGRMMGEVKVTAEAEAQADLVGTIGLMMTGVRSDQLEQPLKLK